MLETKKVDGLVTPMAGADPARVDVELAYETIEGKRRDLDTLFKYYDGPQPLVYSTERLRQTFDKIKAHFEINWMSVVVDAALDRLQLNGFTTQDEATDAKLKDIFDRLHIDIEADKAHQASLATSQSYVIVWRQNEEVVLYYNDPRMCHVFYDDADPHKKRFAAKKFERGDKKGEITLYYPDRLEHWASSKADTDKASSYTLESQEANPFGVIPVFALSSPGEIFKVLSQQDAINKLFSDMMVAAEFGAFIQRYVISQSDPGNLKNRPGEIWWIPAGDGQGEDSKIGEFSPTELKNYLDAMDKIANYIAIITRTPKHYFISSGANLSGEALLAMEAPLVKKCAKRQKQFQAQWQDIAAFIAQLSGITVLPDDVTCLWERVESVQPKTEMETLEMGVNSGIPLEVLLRRMGWSAAEIDEVVKTNEEKQGNLLELMSAGKNNEPEEEEAESEDE
jgi:hypothetical protein